MKYFLVFLTMFTFSNCRLNKCPPDEKTGSIELDSSTRAFNPYVGDEHLFFKNQDGEEIELYAPDGLTESIDHLCYEVTCTEVEFGSPSSCNYYDAESNRINFVNDEQELLFDLALFSEVLRQDETLFFDEVRMGLSTIDAFGSASTVSKIRFTEPYDSSELNIQEWLTFEPEVYDFSDVYVYEGEFLSFYYTKEMGLVGFELDSDIWWLDRIER